MKDDRDDPRRKAILHSAWDAFAAYGFRKTSMDDIARGAGMSRAALYLHYRNKEDICRSLARVYYDEAAAGVGRALAAPGSPQARLSAAFAAQGGEIMEAMLSSPHGLELLDTTGAAAADVAAEGEATLRRIYADWLEAEAAAGRIALDRPADAVADTITAALKGIKSAAPAFETYQGRIEALAALIGAGLAPRGGVRQG